MDNGRPFIARQMETAGLINYKDISEQSSLSRVRGLVGWENCKWKTFTGRDGSFAPDPYQFMISFWVHDRKLKKLYTPQTLPTIWKLAEGGVPVSIAQWEIDNIKVTTTIFANWVNDATQMVNFARTSIKNDGLEKKDISLYAIIYPNPLHPQEIKQIEYDGKNLVNIDGKISLFLKEEADKLLPEDKEISDIEEFGNFKVLGLNNKIIENSNGAIVYRKILSSGEEKAYDFLVPCGDESKGLQDLDFSINLKNTKEYWQKRVPMKIKLPDDRYMDCFYASIYYQLIMMEDYKLCPGPLNYKGFFLHDAVDMVNSLDIVGLHKVAGKALAYFDFKEGDNYLDGLGGSIFSLYEHYRITKDEKFLEEVYPKILERCQLIKRLRAKQLNSDLKDTAVYGLMPTSLSQDNWKLPSHLYLDNWWAVIGLKSGMDAAKILKKDEDFSSLSKEYEDFLKCLCESFKKIMKRDNISYIPGFADYWPPEMRIIDEEHRILGDTQMAWAHRPALVPGQSLGIEISLETLAESYKYYWDVAGKFSNYDGGWYVEYEKYFWGYNIMISHPLLHLGMNDIALKSLQWNIEHQSCPGGWSESMKSRVNETGLREVAEGVVGDVPHGWVAAHYILFIRDMLLREYRDKLIILPCVPEDWLKDSKVIEIKDAPTYFGKINYSVKKEENILKIKVWGDACPGKGFIFKSPFLKQAIKEVKVNNEAWKGYSGKEVFFDKLPIEIAVSY